MGISTAIRFAVIAGMALSAVSAEAVTYLASRSIGTGTVDLSITTDGTFGSLTAGNIADWTITVQNAGDSFTLLSGNSVFQLTGGLSADASNLSFDFSSTNSFLIRGNAIGGVNPFWCLQGVLSCFDVFGPAEGILSRFDDIDSLTREAYSGLQVIASVSGNNVVPEPASWAMLIAGFGLVGATMRRRRALQPA